MWYAHIKFTETKGGTELGVRLDHNTLDVSQKASPPLPRAAFINLLTAAFVTPSASAISSWVQPSFLSSSARKRRISFQSGLRIGLEVMFQILTQARS
jgi:hypothetical protein